MEAGLTEVGFETGAGKEDWGIESDGITGLSSGMSPRAGAAGFFLLSKESVVVDGDGGGPGSILELVRPGRNLPTYAPLIMRSNSVSPSLGRSKL